MKPLTIVHVLGSFEVGGAEQVALNLAAAHAKEHHLHVVSLAPPPDGPHAQNFARLGVGVHREPKPLDRVDVSLPPRLLRLFRNLRADVVHTHNPATLIYASVPARLCGASLVHTKHGFNQTTKRRAMLRRLLGQSMPHAVVAVSEQTARDARVQRDYPAGHLEVIPNGIDLGAYAPDAEQRAAVRQELGISADAFVIGTVGRMTQVKNQALLVRAAAPLLADGVHLVLIGDGPEHAAVAQLAAACPRPDRVHLLGQRLDTARLMSAFDVFALPSQSEGLPMVVPEAMATALPVLSTAVGGVPEVIEQGATGFLVPPGNASAMRAQLAELIAAPELARACGRAAREVALRDYSTARMAEKYMALYQRLSSR
jgi:glycosyltransferase involved in cell wall biosynthesis